MFHILLLIPLFFLAFQDYKERQVDIFSLITASLCVFCITNIESFIFSCLIFGGLYFYFKNKIMFPDIIISCVCSGYIEFFNLGIFYILISIFSYFLSLIVQDEEIPMITAIFCAYLICLLI